MKILCHLFFLLLTSFVYGKEIYIGSTPANAIVKKFLSIPVKDSVDFIRWKLVTGSEQYSLHCDYGIGKPNTNGFIDPKKIDRSGKLTREGNFYRLHYNNLYIEFAILNENVLHFANPDKSLMRGNGGWSYTLFTSGGSKPIMIKPKPITLPDSMIFQGRTPCREFTKLGLRLSDNCYKMKWGLVLYSVKGKPSTYRARGYVNPVTGTWKFKNGMIILEAVNNPVYLIMPDENILLFTDAKWNLLQGDEDFGYTLNRK